jgi:hypothetical protein
MMRAVKSMAAEVGGLLELGNDRTDAGGSTRFGFADD